MCFEVEMQEVRYLWLVSKFKSKKKLAGEKRRYIKATGKLPLMLLDPKLQPHSF